MVEVVRHPAGQSGVGAVSCAARGRHVGRGLIARALAPEPRVLLLDELPPTTTHAVLESRGVVAAAGPIDEVLTTGAVSAAFDHPGEVEHRRGRWSARAASDPDLVRA